MGSGIWWILENYPVNHKASIEYQDHNNVKHTKMIAHEHLRPFGYWIKAKSNQQTYQLSNSIVCIH
jgi:hypothetical protein